MWIFQVNYIKYIVTIFTEIYKYLDNLFFNYYPDNYFYNKDLTFIWYLNELYINELINYWLDIFKYLDKHNHLKIIIQIIFIKLKYYHIKIDRKI